MRVKVQTAVLLGSLWATVGCEGLAELPDVLDTGSSQVVASNGIKVKNGLNLPNGTTLSNGVNLSNGINLGNGIDLSNGINLSGTGVLDGVTGSYYAATNGNSLQKWLDSSPANNLRILHYLIQCALPASASVRVKYGATYTYAGLANLGPGLRLGVMTQTEKERVTSCILARVNAMGNVINIDLFGPYSGFTSATQTELDTYKVPELAFYGNLFSPTPQVYACNATSMEKGNFVTSRACEGASSDDIQFCDLIQTVWNWAPDGFGCVGSAGIAQCTRVAISGATGGFYLTHCKDPSGHVWPNVMTARVKQKPLGGSCSFNAECQSNNCGFMTAICE